MRSTITFGEFRARFRKTLQEMQPQKRATITFGDSSNSGLHFQSSSKILEEFGRVLATIRRKYNFFGEFGARFWKSLKMFEKDLAILGAFRYDLRNTGILQSLAEIWPIKNSSAPFWKRLEEMGHNEEDISRFGRVQARFWKSLGKSNIAFGRVPGSILEALLPQSTGNITFGHVWERSGLDFGRVWKRFSPQLGRQYDFFHFRSGFWRVWKRCGHNKEKYHFWGEFRPDFGRVWKRFGDNKEKIYVLRRVPARYLEEFRRVRAGLWKSWKRLATINRKHYFLEVATRKYHFLEDFGRVWKGRNHKKEEVSLFGRVQAGF